MKRLNGLTRGGALILLAVAAIIVLWQPLKRLFIVVVGLLFFSFGGDYGISLQSGYEVSRINSGSFIIVNAEKKVVIFQTVDGYWFNKKIIAGHVTVDKVNRDNVPPGSYGYFIIDLENSKVSQGLEEKEWLLSLAKYGINQKPVLKKPSRFNSKEGIIGGIIKGQRLLWN